MFFFVHHLTDVFGVAGPYHYDGWSSMKQLQGGEIPLVVRKKHALYKLTSSGPLAGQALAKAMHKWCHDCCNCPCGDL